MLLTTLGASEGVSTLPWGYPASRGPRGLASWAVCIPALDQPFLPPSLVGGALNQKSAKNPTFYSIHTHQLPHTPTAKADPNPLPVF